MTLHRPKRDSAKRDNRSKGIPLVFLLLLSITTPAQAQQPDAGTVINEIKKNRLVLPKGSRHALPVEDPPRPALKPSKIKIALMGISLRGNTVFTTQKLISLVDHNFTKKLAFSDIVDLSNKITHYYRDQGYLLARAYIPAQEVENGVVRISILEGTVDNVIVENESQLSDRAFAAKELLPMNKPLKQADLERGILLLNDIRGAEVSATLTRGQRVGTSDLVLRATSQERFNGYLELDNSGNEFTGEYRAGGSINYASPFGLGDTAALRILETGEGLTYGRASWQTPIGGKGYSASLYYSKMDYSLGGALEQSDAAGNSTIVGVGSSYPLKRSLDRNIYLAGNLETIDLQDNVGNDETTKSIDLVSITVSGTSLGEQSVNSWSATVSSGELTINPDTIDTLTAETAGSYQKININYAQLYHLDEAWSVYGAAYGQWASKNLDSSEKFGITGANAVRAYSQGEVLGDIGYLFAGELRYGFENGMELSSFLEIGSVKANAKIWEALRQTENYENTRSLSGIGLGLYWEPVREFSIKASLATPIASQPRGDIVENENGDINAWLQLVYQL